MRRGLGVIGGAGTLLLIGAGLLLTVGGRGQPDRKLIGDDFGRLRREALDLFTRGQPVVEVKDGLTALGFQCAPAHRLPANINAPSIECDSAGRGYPEMSRMEVTVMARNGTMSDIAVGNGIDPFEASARTPDPNPGGRHSRTASR